MVAKVPWLAPGARYTYAMSSLYIDHFGLTKPPFQITPDLDFFFSGGRRGDILAALLHVATHDEGIITLVAEVGSGKTLLARLMIRRLDAQVCAVYLSNPCFSRDEIIAAIGRDMGLTDLPSTMEGKLAALQQELLRRHALGQRVVLVIDEAHAMPVESLEEIRLLSNLETAQHKLINIMLFGQPELDVLLADPHLRQLRDRVIHRFELQALQASETSAYIDHRLRAAGWQGAGLFSEGAMARLIKASDGRARRINLLADKALLAAYAEGALTVELAHVNAAVHELPMASMRPKAKHRRFYLPMWGASLVGAVIMTVVAVSVLGGLRAAPHAATSSSAPTPTSLTTPTAPSTHVAADAPLEPLVASAPPQPIVGKKAVDATPPVAAASGQPQGLSAYAQVVIDRTKAHVNADPMNGYTVQLVALDSSAGLDYYLRQIEAQLAAAAQIYAQFSDYNGKTYVAVYFGHFASSKDAYQAIESLPLSIRANRPLVRSWAKVKLEQTP